MNTQKTDVVQKNKTVSLKKIEESTLFLLVLWAELTATVVAGTVLGSILIQNTQINEKIITYSISVLVGGICCFISVYHSRRATKKNIEKMKQEVEESEKKL